MENILIPVALCGGLGLLLSVVLVIAAKLFEVLQRTFFIPFFP